MKTTATVEASQCGGGVHTVDVAAAGYRLRQVELLPTAAGERTTVAAALLQSATDPAHHEIVLYQLSIGDSDATMPACGSNTLAVTAREAARYVARTDAAELLLRLGRVRCARRACSRSMSRRPTCRRRSTRCRLSPPTLPAAPAAESSLAATGC